MNIYLGKMLIMIRLKSLWVKLFLIVFYTVGVIGLLLPATHSLFVKMVPGALILSALLLVLFHEDGLKVQLLGLLAVIFLISFFVEAVGVNTGVVFGNYQYGNALGVKLFNTPLMIGLNWVSLVYLSSSVAIRYFSVSWKSALIASFMMIAYDLVLEQVAPIIDMWYWHSNVIPMQNYLAWFVLALIFNGLISWLKVKIYNSLALMVLICQFLFFLSLLIFNKI
jgi:putative membrane protein